MQQGKDVYWPDRHVFGKCGDPASGFPALRKPSQIANIAPYADSLSCMDDRIGIKSMMPVQVRDRPRLPEMLNPQRL
ncbi:hypothetical protein ACFSQQ_22845 [Mesorhizobium kowhaii]|uniref:hypothetical protein n=1 Tax=Mesorhizobium kowhaii TaxID=1300272 RepID=UPI0035E4D197